MNDDSVLPISRAKILCVDDTEANLIALQSLLKREEYEVVEAHSGEEALEKVKADDFAVILLDVQMPGMDGFATARAIHALERSRVTPIIFLTAIYPSESYALQAYEAGAIDYLYKPLNTDILRAKVAAFVALSRAQVDIHKLQAAESVLRKALKVRDEFLSIASHELKTPITPLQLQLQGFMRLIESDRIHEVSKEHLLNILGISDAQVTRLTHLVDQLLNVTRFDEGRFHLDLSDVNLTDLIRSCLAQLKRQVEAAECRLSVHVQDGITGRWDRLRLEQVVFNLIGNATKYAAGGWIEVTAYVDGDTAVFSVADTGMGIAKEDQERIFGRFERAVSAKHYSGLGLGLYVSNQIVKSHGGRILVDAEPGKGSRFTVEIPRFPDVSRFQNTDDEGRSLHA